MEKTVSQLGELPMENDGEDLDMSAEQIQCLTEMRSWVQTEAKFNGRTDDEFLIMFLRGCEFQLEMTKENLDTYYNCRKTVPQWWTNRDLRDPNIMALAQLKITTAIIDKHRHQPSVVIMNAERIGTNLDNINNYCKLASIILDVAMRRHNCQLNGAIWIIDCRNYPLWFALQAIKPTFIRNVMKHLYNGSAIQVQKVVVVEPPFMAYVASKLIQPFLSQALHQRIHFCSADSVSDHVAAQLLPIEYGGEAGPMAQHEEAFLSEMIAFNDYLVEDNKYGYQP